jgi:hypothetical protein
MAEKSAKKNPKKPAKAESSVLGNLPATRPARIGGERRGAATTRKRTTSAAATATTTKPRPKTARPAKPKTSAPKQAEAKAAKLRKPEPAPPAGWQTPGQDAGDDGGTNPVSTAVQAAGELAQLGVTIGGQLLKRAAGRIPRP